MIDGMRVGFTIKEMNERLQQAFDEGEKKGRLAELKDFLKSQAIYKYTHKDIKKTIKQRINMLEQIKP